MTPAFLNNLIDLLTGSLWTYPILLGICAGDAVFPALPSETAMIVCGIQAGRGQLSLAWVMVFGGAGAFLGDNTQPGLLDYCIDRTGDVARCRIRLKNRERPFQRHCRLLSVSASLP